MKLKKKEQERESLPANPSKTESGTIKKDELETPWRKEHFKAVKKQFKV